MDNKTETHIYTGRILHTKVHETESAAKEEFSEIIWNFLKEIDGHMIHVRRAPTIRNDYLYDADKFVWQGTARFSVGPKISLDNFKIGEL